MKRLKVRVHDTTAQVGSRSCSLQIGNVFVGVLSPDDVDNIIKALQPHRWGNVSEARAKELGQMLATPKGGAR